MNNPLTVTAVWLAAIIAAALVVAVVTYRKRPTRQHLTLPTPAPAVQHAVNTGDAFDRAVDEALAIANDKRPAEPHMHGTCMACGGRTLCFRDASEVIAHIRTHQTAAAHFNQWETELTTPTRKDQP